MTKKLPPGLQLQNRYRIIRLLGEGGYGAVYLVEDMRLGGKYLALKESFDNSGEAQQQFQLEARLLANLSHPHLPRVTDYFIESSGRQYLVMDYVDGQELTEILIQRQQSIQINQAVTWITQVCQAVAHLHSQQPNPIIHRDIKPHNIKITASNQAVLVDFGIAKLYVPQKGTARIAKAVSKGFSPPEQYAGGTDARSDVYALGATLYSLLTVSLPPDAFDRIIKGTPLAQPSRINPQVTPGLQQIVLRAMDLDPRRRFPSAQEMSQALQAYLSGRPISGPRPAVAVAPATQHCSQCRQPNRSGAKFCMRCGTRLFTQPQPAMQVPSPVQTPSPSSNSPALNFEIGNTYARNQEFTLAIQAYQQAQAGGFSESALYHNLGLSFILANRHSQAIPILRQGISRYPQDSDIYYQLGRAYALNKQLTESVNALQQAKRLKPKNEAVRLLLGMVLQDQKQHSQAIVELEEAIKLDKDSASAHFLLGKSYLLSKQPAKAEKALLDAIRLSSTDKAQYYYFLGVALHHQKKTTTAIKALQIVIQLEQKHFMAHYIIGEAYMDQQKWLEAASWFQKAAPLDPSDPDPHTSVAICYTLLKRNKDAIAAIQRALTIDPSNKRAQEILKKL